MANYDTIDTTNIHQLAKSEFVDYADSDIVIIDDLRNFSMLQAVKVDFLLIIVVTSGRLAIKANKVGTTASVHDIVICQPNTILNECLFSLDFTAKAVCLSAETARQMLHVKDVLSLSFYLKNKPIIHIDEASMGTFEKYHALLSEQLLKEETPYKKQIVSHLVSSFLFCLLTIIGQGSPQRTPIPMSRGNLLFKQSVELLVSLEVRPRNVGYYSGKLCVSSKYLSNICKDNSGKTAYEWIMEYVVEDIRRLLSHSDMSVKEIADRLGFPNLSFFGKFVRAHLGCSPTHYRRINENCEETDE